MREESSSTALVVSALVPLVIDQITSLRECGVTECILSGHAGVGKELVVTASDMSKCLVLWRLASAHRLRAHACVRTSVLSQPRAVAV